MPLPVKRLVGKLRLHWVSNVECDVRNPGSEGIWPRHSIGWREMIEFGLGS